MECVLLWLLILITIWVDLTHESSVHHKEKFTRRDITASSSYLPPIPANLTSLDELLSKTTQSSSSSLSKSLPFTIEERFKLAQMTDTKSSCFSAPPSDTVVDMNKLMGTWYMVRIIKNADGKNQRFTCEEAIYTKTGAITFNKVADVHFHDKWLRIKGNGTFIKPGIIIFDWRVASSKPNIKPNRLVYTVVGTDYDDYIVGYNCHQGHDMPEIVLQVRNLRVSMKYINQAYSEIEDNDLPAGNMDCHVGFRRPRATKPTGTEPGSNKKASLTERQILPSPPNFLSLSSLPSALPNLSSSSTLLPVLAQQPTTLAIFNQLPSVPSTMLAQLNHPAPLQQNVSTFSKLPSISLSPLTILSLLSKSEPPSFSATKPPHSSVVLLIERPAHSKQILTAMPP